MTPETEYEFVEIHRGIADHVKHGILTWTDASLFIWLLLKADPRTGIAYSCAPTCASETKISVHTVRKALNHLRSMDWIRYETRGQRGDFPIEIVGYPAPECVASWGDRRRPRPAVRADRLLVLERDGYTCQYCGAGPLQARDLHVDHVVPLSRGGPDIPENKVAACSHCNLSKGAKELWTEWVPSNPTVRVMAEHGD